MKTKLLIKAVMLVAALSLLCGLTGCKKKTEYSVGDIISVSTACGHMDYSRSYSFYIVKKGERWLFSADCSKDTESERIQFEDRAVSDEDVNELLSLTEARDEIRRLESHKEPKLKVFVLDETAYSSMICFSSGETLSAKTKMSDETVELFYRLSDKYNNTASHE